MRRRVTHRSGWTRTAQLKAAASLPWVAKHVAVMPDVHAGRGELKQVVCIQG
jgi:RNA-splicing ligase RtcB